VPEYRYLAIQALGRLRAPRALPVIAEILQEEHPDIYLAYCAVAAAANIPGPGSLAILEKAARHPYRLQGTA
jgi:HEAT repeat protein